MHTVATIRNLDYNLIKETFGPSNYASDKDDGWEIITDSGFEIIIGGTDGLNWTISAEADEQNAAMTFVRNAFPSLGRFDVKEF